MPRRRSRGRQRIPMRLIENQDDLYATFSKRRRGLYNKAGELSTLCGASIGIIIFSPTNKPYSFWHPSFQPVLQRFVNPNLPIDNHATSIEAHAETRLQNHNRHLDEVLDEKDFVKQQEKQIEEIDQTKEKMWWEQTLVESLNQDQSKEWRTWFEDFITQVYTVMDEKTQETNSTNHHQQQQQNASNPPFAPNPSMFSQGFPLGTSFRPTVQMVRPSQSLTQYYNVPPLTQISFFGDGTSHVPDQYYHPTQVHFPNTSGGTGFLQFHGMLNYFPPPAQAQTASSTGLGAASSSGGTINYFPLQNTNPTKSGPVHGAIVPSTLAEVGEPLSNRGHRGQSTHGEAGESSMSRGD